MRKFCSGLFVILLSVALIGGIGLTVKAKDDDGDGVPNPNDNYPGRSNLKYGGTLKIGRGLMPPSTLSSLRTSYGDQIHQYLSEPPLMWGPKGEFGPSGWIEKFEQSENNKVLTFHLKKGIKFHDGTPLDAEAFAWLLRERLRDDSLYSYPLKNVDSPKDIQVSGSHTVTIKQTKPWAELARNMSSAAWLGGMETPRAIERYGEDYGTQEVYGNGPFKFVEWVKDDHITLKRNEGYNWAPSWAWKYSDIKSKEDYTSGPPFLEKLIFKYVPESSTRVQMLLAGELDMILEVPKSNAKQLESSSKVNVMTQPSYSLKFIAYNTTTPPLDEKKVRQALNYAINREAVAKAGYFGYATPAYSMYLGKPQETSNTLHLYKQDIEKARQLLSDGGWKDNNGDGFREKNGNKLTFRLMAAEKSEYRRIATLIQEMWRKIGVDAKVRLVTYSTLKSRTKGGKHEAVIDYHQWPFLDQYPWWFNPDLTWYPYRTGFESKKMRSLHQNLVESTTSIKEEKEAIDKLINYYYQQAAQCALVHPQRLLAVREGVQNAVPGHMEGGNWAWAPYLYDVYLEDIYKTNQEKQGN